MTERKLLDTTVGTIVQVRCIFKSVRLHDNRFKQWVRTRKSIPDNYEYAYVVGYTTVYDGYVISRGKFKTTKSHLVARVRFHKRGIEYKVLPDDLVIAVQQYFEGMEMVERQVNRRITERPVNYKKIKIEDDYH